MNSIRQRKIERLLKGEPPRVLDLFAGAGGLSLGFLSAGFEITAAVEIDLEAARTHALNFFRDKSEDVRYLHGKRRDITQVEPDDLMREYGYESPEEAIDVIIGGPPCQAFARVGRAKLREVARHPEAFLQDPRANLYLRFIHYVNQLQPLVILMENVPDALNHGGHNIAQETCELFSSSEPRYRCSYTLLNSAFYGVPQMRDRMFLLALAEELGQDVQFPSPTNWIELPYGYEGTRSVALRPMKSNGYQIELFGDRKVEKYLNSKVEKETNYYIEPPNPSANLPKAVSSQDALADLAPIYALELLKEGKLHRGVHDPAVEIPYPKDVTPTKYGWLMRNWPSFETKDLVTAHIIRYLPRDYKLFARLKPGDQYPQAYQCAIKMYEEELVRRTLAGEPVPANLKQEYVPPYDPGKFPNKWRKMESNLPARTLMAHIGKDSYSHIHYDSDQARTISIREAARLQSFPDGFQLYGKMNASFRQIGNAVPPLLAYHLAVTIIETLGLRPKPLF